jgi:hypothetical protein
MVSICPDRDWRANQTYNSHSLPTFISCHSSCKVIDPVVMQMPQVVFRVLKTLSFMDPQCCLHKIELPWLQFWYGPLNLNGNTRPWHIQSAHLVVSLMTHSTDFESPDLSCKLKIKHIQHQRRRNWHHEEQKASTLNFLATSPTLTDILPFNTRMR